MLFHELKVNYIPSPEEEEEEGVLVDDEPQLHWLRI
jgi:hypothetical protein